VKALKISLALVTVYTAVAGYGVYKALMWRP
jgi:hypothetical protein